VVDQVADQRLLLGVLMRERLLEVLGRLDVVGGRFGTGRACAGHDRRKDGGSQQPAGERT